MAEALIKAHLCSEFAPLPQLKLADKLFYWPSGAISFRSAAKIHKQKAASSQWAQIIATTPSTDCACVKQYWFSRPTCSWDVKLFCLCHQVQADVWWADFSSLFCCAPMPVEKVNPCLGSGEKRGRVWVGKVPWLNHTLVDLPPTLCARAKPNTPRARMHAIHIWSSLVL